MFEKLTECIPYLENEQGRELYHPEEHGGMPLPIYIEEMIYTIRDDTPMLQFTNFSEIIRSHGVEWSEKSMLEADVSGWDARSVFALVIALVRAERYAYGIYDWFLENGTFLKWLLRLKELDDAENAKGQLNEKKATGSNKKTDDKLIRYSMQLAYLHTLLSEKLISETEYSRIKKKLMKDYGIGSDILSDFRGL